MISFKVRVAAIHEHSRTIRGRRDSLGQVYTEEVNLGWFLHLELMDGEPFGVAIGIGPDRPNGVEIGDVLKLTLAHDAG